MKMNTSYECLSSQGTIDCPDLDFVYDDADKHPNETAELYSYTEGPEFQSNIKVCPAIFM